MLGLERRKENAVMTRGARGGEHFVRDQLGSPGRHQRMIVGEEENAHGSADPNRRRRSRAPKRRESRKTDTD